LVSAGITGASYYVSPSGNDANAGTSPGTAWQTIAKINAQSFNPGDAILFQGGQTYSGAIVCPSSGTAAKPITFGSYGGGQATISSGASSGFTSTAQAGIIVRDLIFTGNGTTNNVDGVFFNNNQAGNTKLFNIQVLNCNASGYGNSGIHVVGTNGTSGYRNVTIRGCLAQNNCFQADSSPAGPYGFANGTGGIYVNSPAAWTTGASGVTAHADVLISNCSALSNAGTTDTNWTGSGIIIGETNTGLIDNCWAISNGASAAGSGGGPVGIWMFDCINCTIDNCNVVAQHTASGGDGDGFDMDIGTVNGTIKNSYSTLCDGIGFLIDNDSSFYANATSNRNYVINCVSYNDCRAVSGSGSFHVFNNGTGAVITDFAIQNCTAYLSGSGAAANASPLQFSGGTLSGVSGRISGCSFSLSGNSLDFIRSSGNPTSALITGNAYYSSTGEWTAHWNSVFYNTLAAIQAAVSNVEGVGVNFESINTGHSLITNTSATGSIGYEIDDKATNGGDWLLQASVNSTFPYFALYEARANRSYWTANFDNAGSFQLIKGGTLGWTNDNLFSNVAADTGISRTAAATVAIGNGTAGDFTASLKAAKLGLGMAPVEVADFNGNCQISDNGINVLSQIFKINTRYALYVMPNASGDNWFIGEAGPGGGTVTGSLSCAMGVGSLNHLSSGSANMAIGAQALAAETTGSQNVAIGTGAQQLQNGASNNVGVGHGAGFSNNGSSSANVSIGNRAGVQTTSGASNTFIGGDPTNAAATGNTVTTGSNNICIGSNCDVPSASANGQISIGNMIYGTGCTATGSTISTGWIGIGVKAAYGTELFAVAGGIAQNEAANLIHAHTALSNSAGASAGTLTNAPVAGNPTKWITIDDAGTARRIPAW
jgi:hypothetical protein